MDNPEVIDRSLKTSYSALTSLTQIPKDLIGNILDITYDKFNTISDTKNSNKNIKSCHKNVMIELKLKSRPNCGTNCRFIRILWVDGDPISIPALYRSSHKICEMCNNYNVSEYNFNTCHNCANENEFPEEFYYYHNLCN